MRRRRKITVAGILALVVGMVWQVWQAQTTAPEVLSAESDNSLEWVGVKEVVDGDTVVLEDGRRLRYIGVDTPETKHPKKQVECYGMKAYERNKQLVEGKRVGLERDVSETDRYGRLLRYVYVDGVMINWLLVHEGVASAATFPPDVANQQMLAEAEKEAQEFQRGMWNPSECAR